MAIRSQDYHFPDSPVEDRHVSFDTSTTWSNWRDQEHSNILGDSDDDLLGNRRKSRGLSSDLKQRENAYNKWKNDYNILSINDRNRNKGEESTDTWSNWRDEDDVNKDNDINQSIANRRSSERDVKWTSWRDEENDLYNDNSIKDSVANRRKSERDIKWSNWREMEKKESEEVNQGMTSSQSWNNWREQENAINYDEDSSSSIISKTTSENTEKPKEVQRSRHWQNWREMEARNETSKKYVTDTIIEKDDIHQSKIQFNPKLWVWWIWFPPGN